jgi:hypothetical protein
MREFRNREDATDFFGHRSRRFRESAFFVLFNVASGDAVVSGSWTVFQMETTKQHAILHRGWINSYANNLTDPSVFGMRAELASGEYR